MGSAIPTITHFEPQHLSNTAWAYSTLGICSQPLLDAIASSSIPTLSEFDGQALSNTAFAFAALELWHHGPVLDAMSTRSVAQAPLVAAISAAPSVKEALPLHQLLDVSGEL